jgi:hypothetical protein
MAGRLNGHQADTLALPVPSRRWAPSWGLVVVLVMAGLSSAQAQSAGFDCAPRRRSR